MAINLNDLLVNVIGWRRDLEAENAAICLDALKQSAREIASLALNLRELVDFTQPSGNPVIQPYTGKTTERQCLRVFAIRNGSSWLSEVDGVSVGKNIQDPTSLSAGAPSRFCPVQTGAILDRRPTSESSLRALVAFTLPPDTDEWPFSPDVAEVLIDGALYHILERPGKYQDLRLALQKRAQYNAGVTRLANESARGFKAGDFRYAVQMPGIIAATDDDTGTGGTSATLDFVVGVRVGLPSDVSSWSILAWIPWCAGGVSQFPDLESRIDHVDWTFTLPNQYAEVNTGSVTASASTKNWGYAAYATRDGLGFPANWPSDLMENVARVGIDTVLKIAINKQCPIYIAKAFHTGIDSSSDGSLGYSDVKVDMCRVTAALKDSSGATILESTTWFDVPQVEEQ